MAREQDRQRHRAIYGEHQAGRPSSGYRSPEVCAEVDRKWQPTHDLLRQWCGQDVVEKYDEVRALREEISKLVTLSEHAILSAAVVRATEAVKTLDAVASGRADSCEDQLARVPVRHCDRADYTYVVMIGPWPLLRHWTCSAEPAGSRSA